MRFVDLLHSAGLLLPDRQNTVWLFTNAGEIYSIYPFVDEALRQRPGYRLTIAVPYHELAKLRRQFPHEEVVPNPSKYACARSRPYANSALQILGSRVAHLSAAVPNGLKVDDNFVASSIVSRLPERTSTYPSVGTRPLMSFLTRVMAGNPICEIDDLACRLRQPQDILCLGNGPSSEDARLVDISYDCLFRVNWIWSQRTSHVNPNLVFTADRDLPAGSPKPILGFPNEAVGLPILRYHSFMFRPPRQGYIFIDTLIPTLKARRSEVVPSNGAIMISLAAALKPKRMIIAGIDLYTHKEGRYPGDSHAIDGYSRDHNRTNDVAFIRSALSAYRGEVIILSDSLREELKNENDG
jgi:hypothetical protein